MAKRVESEGDEGNDVRCGVCRKLFEKAGRVGPVGVWDVYGTGAEGGLSSVGVGWRMAGRRVVKRRLFQGRARQEGQSGECVRGWALGEHGDKSNAITAAAAAGVAAAPAEAAAAAGRPRASA